MLFLFILIFFGLWIKFRLKASDRSAKVHSHTFWEREKQANSIRRQPLDSIPLISIPLHELPIQESPSEIIAGYQESIQSLAEKKIANLSDQSNTELKTLYGAANLETLTEYDQNYTQLLRLLCQWGEALYKEGLYQQAQTVLAFGIRCGTDISKHYTLLAEIYKQENRPERITELLSTAGELDSLMKPAILKSLNNILESCQTPE